MKYFQFYGDILGPQLSLEADIESKDTDKTRRIDPDQPETPNILKMGRKGHFDMHFLRIKLQFNDSKEGVGLR